MIGKPAKQSDASNGHMTTGKLAGCPKLMVPVGVSSMSFHSINGD